MPTKTAKPPGEMTPQKQLERFHDAVGSPAHGDIPKPKPPGKLGAEKLTPEEQRRRFEELAREAGCDEASDARFETAISVIGRHKPKRIPNDVE